MHNTSNTAKDIVKRAVTIIKSKTVPKWHLDLMKYDAPHYREIVGVDPFITSMNWPKKPSKEDRKRLANSIAYIYRSLFRNQYWNEAPLGEVAAYLATGEDPSLLYDEVPKSFITRLKNDAESFKKLMRELYEENVLVPPDIFLMEGPWGYAPTKSLQATDPLYETMLEGEVPEKEWATITTPMVISPFTLPITQTPEGQLPGIIGATPGMPESVAAHEVGHNVTSARKSWTSKLYGPSQVLFSLFSALTLAARLAELSMLAANPNPVPPFSVLPATLATLSAIPFLAEEIKASYYGGKELYKRHKTLSSFLKPFVGVPTYLMSAAMPAAIAASSVIPKLISPMSGDAPMFEIGSTVATTAGLTLAHLLYTLALMGSLRRAGEKAYDEGKRIEYEQQLEKEQKKKKK